MRAGARLFPGERRIWQVGALVLAVIGVLILIQLLKPRQVLYGSNGVAPRNNGSEVLSGQQVCASRIRVPSGATKVRWSFDTRTAGKPAMSIEVRLWESLRRRGANPETVRGHVAAAPDRPGLRYVDIPLDRPLPAGPHGERLADICVTPHGGSIFPWGNALSGNADRPLTIDGQVVPDPRFRPTLQFLGPDGDRAMLWRLNSIFERMSLFRPGFVGPWTYWVLFFAVLPLLGYLGLRLLAGADRRSVRRSGLLVYAVAVGTAASWALITPTFQTPDESEHFAAVQYLAETGRAVDAAPDPKRPVPWSTAEAIAIDAAHELPTIESNLAKLPWPDGYERAWQAAADRHGGKGLPRDDGGGFHPATSAHSPAYYALMSPSYLLARDHSPWAQVLAVRWENALVASLVALFAFLAALELMPGRRALAAAAGMFVAFEPMFGFMGGAINNDTGVNACGAALTWLCLRGLRRGLTWRLGAAIGATAALAPIMKGTGYELIPVVGVALLFMLLRGRRDRRVWIGAAVAVAGLAAVTVGWGELSSQFHRSVLTTPGGNSPTMVPGLHNLRRYVSWMWQVLVPEVRLPGMRDLTDVRWPFFNIYIERGFGSFGWYAIQWARWVYLTIVAAGALLLVRGAIFLWQRRDLLRARFGELLFLALIPAAVVFAVEAAYTNLGLVPYDGTPEQGRYGFPAIAACAVIAAGCCRAFGPRRGRLVAAGLVAALFALTLAGQWRMIESFYV